ncbi:ABC transporter substrate-binding protein [Roseitranquillus sediminis]|uniref:ABC transporter substrate-binding protein n=1 Tax=Roseitranquillus sediminis TaxID=2809051 RepID=UPI001D0C8F23|nr:ABC transporter substrate-binding protein [Roseitranquillus sediminis]MBM9594936.1 ABC transporter substrate-binding protein [Roseitranquillus sediminis]
MTIRASILGAAALATAGLAAPVLAQDDVPQQTLNEELHAQLPENIREKGYMTAVNSGSFPPYDFVESSTVVTGASADIAHALSEILGVEIRHASVAGLPALLSGIGSNRFEFAMGPVGDFQSRQEANDFVDWVQEFVVFAVQSGNPLGIEGLDTACGARVAVQAGGSAERVITEQAQKCVDEGREPIEVQSYADQPTSILAVRSDRADAFFSSQAPLTYFVQQSDGQLELAGVGKSNGFQDLYQGAVVSKDSPLGPVLLAGLQELHENGTYEAIMTKWGLENNMLAEPGINLSTW